MDRDFSRPFQTNSVLFSRRCRTGRRPITESATRFESERAAPGVKLEEYPSPRLGRHTNWHMVSIELLHGHKISYSSLSITGSLIRR